MSQIDLVFQRCEAAAGVQLPRRLIRFLSVGLVGLAVHTGVFTLAFHIGTGKKAGWLTGLACATATTWLLNRAFTFDCTGRKTAHEALRYLMVTAVAQGLSFGVFSLALRLAPRIPPTIDVIIGSIAATMLSYAGQRLFTFAPVKRET